MGESEGKVPQGTGEPVPPGKAYEDARISPVYRLAELMFGSLLAAYVLGFVTFAAWSYHPFSPSSGNDLYEIANLLFISLTYAYLTAGLYVTYHAGILTMHHMPLERLAYDFMVALSQAVGFGIAMLSPVSFPFTVGCTLLVAVWRQRTEHREHVNAFYKTNLGYRASPTEKARFRAHFETRLAAYGLLSGWKPPSTKEISAGFLLWGLSLATFLVVDPRSPFAATLLFSYSKPVVLVIEALLIFLVVLYIVHRVLEKRARLLLDFSDMDREFKLFVQDLQNVPR